MDAEFESKLIGIKISDCDELEGERMSDSGDGDCVSDITMIDGGQEIDDFDLIIGHIEDILVDSSFQELQRNFLEEYFKEFDDGDENKLSYMPIFEEYIALIENHLEENLKRQMPDFNMDVFTADLLEKKSELNGEVFEMLYTLTDFTAFKEMVLDYKAAKEGRIIDFSRVVSITPLQSGSNRS